MPPYEMGRFYCLNLKPLLLHLGSHGEQGRGTGALGRGCASANERAGARILKPGARPYSKLAVQPWAGPYLSLDLSLPNLLNGHQISDGLSVPLVPTLWFFVYAQRRMGQRPGLSPSSGGAHFKVNRSDLHAHARASPCSKSTSPRHLSCGRLSSDPCLLQNFPLSPLLLNLHSSYW